jgi:hypothetical protein
LNALFNEKNNERKEENVSLLNQKRLSDSNNENSVLNKKQKIE